MGNIHTIHICLSYAAEDVAIDKYIWNTNYKHIIVYDYITLTIRIVVDYKEFCFVH